MRTKLLVSIIVIIFSNISWAKRLAPVSVEPVTAGDTVYTAPRKSLLDTEQKGGFIEALDAKSGTQKWSVQVYKTNYDPELERDVQDVFIRQIEINFFNTVLTVTDELGRVFEVQIDGKQIKQIQ